jgi:putative redox protein
MSIPTVRAISTATPYAITLRDDLGHEWTGDEPVDLGGGNTGPTPKHLLLSSLGACTAITLQMYAARKQWALAGVEVEVEFHAAVKPATGTDIVRRIALKGELSQEQRERLLAIAESCPIHKVLTGEVRIASSLVAE